MAYLSLDSPLPIPGERADCTVRDAQLLQQWLPHRAPLQLLHRPSGFGHGAPMPSGWECTPCVLTVTAYYSLPLSGARGFNCPKIRWLYLDLAGGLGLGGLASQRCDGLMLEERGRGAAGAAHARQQRIITFGGMCTAQ
jgi:hypothetical protein